MGSTLLHRLFPGSTRRWEPTDDESSCDFFIDGSSCIKLFVIFCLLLFPLCAIPYATTGKVLVKVLIPLSLILSSKEDLRTADSAAARRRALPNGAPAEVLDDECRLLLILVFLGFCFMILSIFERAFLILVVFISGAGLECYRRMADEASLTARSRRGRGHRSDWSGEKVWAALLTGGRHLVERFRQLGDSLSSFLDWSDEEVAVLEDIWTDLCTGGRDLVESFRQLGDWFFPSSYDEEFAALEETCAALLARSRGLRKYLGGEDASGSKLYEPHEADESYSGEVEDADDSYLCVHNEAHHEIYSSKMIYDEICSHLCSINRHEAKDDKEEEESHESDESHRDIYSGEVEYADDSYLCVHNEAEEAHHEIYSSRMIYDEICSRLCSINPHEAEGEKEEEESHDSSYEMDSNDWKEEHDHGVDEGDSDHPNDLSNVEEAEESLDKIDLDDERDSSQEEEIHGNDSGREKGPCIISQDDSDHEKDSNNIKEAESQDDANYSCREMASSGVKEEGNHDEKCDQRDSSEKEEESLHQAEEKDHDHDDDMMDYVWI